MNMISRKSDSLLLKNKGYYGTEARAFAEREKPGLNRTEVTKILKELPHNVFADFLVMFSDYKNRKPFPQGQQRMPVWSKSFQIINKEEVDPKLYNGKEIMHLWCRNKEAETWDDEKERTTFSNYIHSKLSEEEIKKNETIQTCLKKLANFIVNNSLEEYTPNLMNHLREQGLYNEFSELALKIYNPGYSSRHNTHAAENYYNALALEQHVNKLDMLPFNPNDMINGGEYDRVRKLREKEGFSILKNGHNVGRKINEMMVSEKDNNNIAKMNEEINQIIGTEINEELNNNKNNENNNDNNENKYDENDENNEEVNDENFEEINREILGLPNKTNVNNEEEKNEHILTAHGCAILKNSHRLNGLNMIQFFLKNVTDDPNRIINKIRKICFHGVFPFAKQRLSYLGTFVASLKKGAKYHLFEIPASAYSHLINNRDRLQIFGLEDLMRFTLNFHNESDEECTDRWLTNPTLPKREKLKLLEEMGIPVSNCKLNAKAVDRIQTGEFSLVFESHTEAAKAMRILVNHPKFDSKFFTTTWDAALLKDPVLIEKEKEKQAKKKIFTSSYSKEIEEENKMISTQPSDKEIPPETLNFFQKLTSIYQEAVVNNKRKDKKKNLQIFLDLSTKPASNSDANNKNKINKNNDYKNTNEQIKKKNNNTNENNNKKEVSVNNNHPNTKKSDGKNDEEPQLPAGNKMQFWNVQYKLVLEALKANTYDSFKTATALGITIRSLSKTILTLQSKKYDLYLPPSYKLRVGIAETNLGQYKRAGSTNRYNKTTQKESVRHNQKGKPFILEEETSTYKKLLRQRNMERYQKKLDEAAKNNNTTSTNSE